MLLAVISLNSDFFSLLEPTFLNVFSCKTLSKVTCVSFGSISTSSINNVPLFASSISPLRSRFAPVKDPFSCPNSSLAIKSAPVKLG